VVVLLTLAVGTGCAPSTPDAGSWRLHARRAISDVISNVETARLALEQSLDDRVYANYLQTVALDAEKAAGAAAQKLASEQPPQVERERYDTVTGRLDEATGLLAEVRIAVVHRSTGAYPRLVDELRTTAEHLDALEKDLLHPPRKPRPS